MFLKNKQNALIIGISLFVLFLTSTDTILFGTNSSLLFRYVPRIVGLTISIIFVFLSILQKKTISIRLLCIYLLLVLLLFASSLSNGDDLSGTFSRFISITAGFSIAFFAEKELFKKSFSDFIVFISIVAILTEFIAYIAPTLFNFLPGVYNTVGHYFKVFLFGSIEMSEIGNTFIRSNGIFWEPGAYAIYLIIALTFELFSSKKRILFIVIDIIALIITFSTTGYICLAFLFFAYLFKKSKNSSEKAFKIVSLIFAFLAIILLLNESSLLYEYVFGKMATKNSSAGSRFSSFFNGIMVSLQHPLFGVGDSSRNIMNEYIKTTNTWYSNGGSSVNNTFIGYMVSYGIPFSFIMMIGSFLFFKNISSNRLNHIVLFGVLFLAYLGERFFSFLPFVILFYGYRDWIDAHAKKRVYINEKNSVNKLTACR